MDAITAINNKKYIIGVDLAKEPDKTAYIPSGKLLSRIDTPKGGSVWYRLYKEWLKKNK